MPSTSPKQRRFMAAVAHNPEFAAKVSVPQSVGREFNDADALKRQSDMAAELRKPRKPRSGS